MLDHGPHKPSQAACVVKRPSPQHTAASDLSVVSRIKDFSISTLLLLLLLLHIYHLLQWQTRICCRIVNRRDSSNYFDIQQCHLISAIQSVNNSALMSFLLFIVHFSDCCRPRDHDSCLEVWEGKRATDRESK